MAAHRKVARFGATLVLGAAFLAASGTASLAAGTEATVTIAALRFTPDRLDIVTGTVVVWENKEPIDYPVVRGVHKIVADDGSFASNEIAPGTRFSHRFLLPGTFPYRCALGHPLMTGTIVVTGEPIHEPSAYEVGIREGSPGDPDSWGFSPNDIRIIEGDTITWRNEGSTAHTVTSDTDAFDSGEIAPGSAWQRRFSLAGVYQYHCTPHPWMQGLVRVARPGHDPPTAPDPPGHNTATGPDADVTPVVVSNTATGPARVSMRIVEPNLSSPDSWGFTPREVRIRSGDTVVWENQGAMLHTVTADDGSFDRDMQPGSTWERRFDSPGTFSFHCRPHPWMKGTIVVSERNTASAPPATLFAAPHDFTAQRPGSTGHGRAIKAESDPDQGTAAATTALRIAAWLWAFAVATGIARVGITRRPRFHR